MLRKPLKHYIFRGTEKHDFRSFEVCSTQVKDIKDYGKTLTAAQSRLFNYLSVYQEIFRSKRKKFFDKAQLYTQGILLAHRCNIEQIADNLLVPDYTCQKTGVRILTDVKGLVWHHQLALNIMTMCFMLKEKLFCFRDLRLLSARDINDWLCYNMTNEMTEIDVIKLIFNRHFATETCYK